MSNDETRERADVRYLTTGQAGRRWGVTSETVREWIRQGRVPAVITPGGYYRIAEDDVTPLPPAPRAES